MLSPGKATSYNDLRAPSSCWRHESTEAVGTVAMNPVKSCQVSSELSYRTGSNATEIRAAAANVELAAYRCMDAARTVVSPAP